MPASSSGLPTSEGIAAFHGCTSSRSTKPGSDPSALPVNVVPERGRHRSRRRSRIRDELLVAHLDRPLGHGTGRADVATPRPGGARCIRDATELLLATRLHPEARVRAEGETRVVGAGPLGAEPAALEERGGDVAAVADHVDRDRLRVGAKDGGEDEARLGCLLDAPEPAREPEAAHTLEDPPEAHARLVVGTADQRRDRGLPRLHLVEVDEPGQ